MPYSITQIKSFASIDLDNFEIRGAKTGVNNARSTGTLFVQGQFNPSKTVLSGSATLTSGDSTVTGITFNAPFSGLNASIFVEGDTINVGSDSLPFDKYISPTSVKVKQAPSSSGTNTASYRLSDRDYLIEPDIVTNTTTGLATFVSGSEYVTGSGTQWLTDLVPGDSIQLNSYQKFFIIDTVVSDTSIKLTKAYTGDTKTGFYTAKRWRLGRLDYQYTKNNFSYDKNKFKWIYDSTTENGRVAYNYYDLLRDGVELKFSETLNPVAYPDLMDSNLVLNKTLTKSIENPLYQYSLPVVPNPEESFQLFINDAPKDMFPNGNMDYVLTYWQIPTYEYPPPVAQRSIAAVMPLQKVQDIVLDPADTALGDILFRDSAGKPVSGIMPGSETILFSGVDQTAYKDYVIDLDSGLGFSSQHNTNEEVVKYVAYEQKLLFEYGIKITLDGTRQTLTIPHDEADDVLFEFESGRFKPATKDNPASGEEYIIEYLVEGEFITDEIVKTTPGMTWFRVNQYPIKYQGAIVSKNGIIIDEGSDYRISYLTGRIVLFEPLVRGDTITVSYSPLLKKKNGIIYENKKLQCKVYEALTPVTNVSPPEFTLSNQNLPTTGLTILKIRNATKGFDYDIANYILRGLLIHLQPTPANVSIKTDLTDTILVDYKFENESVEYTPVEYINFFIEAGQDYIAFIDRDVRSLFPKDTFIRLTNVETAGDFFFRIRSASYDGFDTTVTVYGEIPSDITNPVIYISDSPITGFLDTPRATSNIASGSTDIYFPGSNISRTFRLGQLLNIGDDYYYVQGSSYDSSNRRVVVTLGVQAYQDYAGGVVKYSDCPIYYVGDSTVSTVMEIIDDPQTPAMTLNYDGMVTVTSDSSAIAVDVGTVQYSYLFSSYPTVYNVAQALSGLGIDVETYAPDWTSSKILPVQNAVVTKDSTTLINISPALRYYATDTTNFSISAGDLVLSKPLVKNDRYSFDYLGLDPLEDATVKYSASYFTYYPAKTKIAASFKFDNLDQFYVQAMSQRDFLESVTEPRMKEEAIQQSGSVGQGGEVAGDDDAGKSSGGLTGDEYRRMDTAIECRIFNIIFDFFNGRVQAFSDEMYAAFGWRLCNTDGQISLMDESCGARSVNRMFPWSDYTSFPPYTIMPLTGQAIPYGTMGPYRPPTMPTALAQFTPSSTTVTCTTTGTYPTYWTKQLKANDYIRPIDSTTDYQIQTVNSDSQVTLTTPYSGPVAVTKPPVMISKYPLYDDDGHMGGKIVGTVSDGFGLVSGDVFSVTVDGVTESYTFSDPLPPLISASNLTGIQIANLLTASLSRTRVTYEWIQDINSAYCYKSVLVLRTKGTYNKITVGSGSATSKLGFTAGSSDFGNNNNTDSDPEYPHTVQEASDLATEDTNLATLISAGTPNILGRVTPANIALGVTIKNMASDEAVQITTEMARLSTEISALSKIILEPTMAAYTQSLIAYNNDTTYYGNCPSALAYDQSLGTNYEGQLTSAKWILDIQPGQQTILGKDSSGMGVPVSSGSGITQISGENTFTIHVDSDGTNDKRFLNTTVDGVPYIPSATYIDTATPVDGTWSGGWDPSVSNQYSLSANNITFVLNDSTPQFVLDYRVSSFSYQSDTTSMTVYWDTTRSKEYLYSTYPTVGSLKIAINKLAGVTTSGSSVYDGSSSYAIIPKPFAPLSPNVVFDKTSMLMFTMYQDSSLSYDYWIDATSLYLKKDTTTWSLLFATYPTILSIRNQVDGLPGLAITPVPAHDSSSSAVLQAHSTAPVGGGAPLYDQTYSLFTLTNDNIYSHTYYVDKTGVGLAWSGDSKLYAYSIYSTVGSMKNAINADIPGINATGPASYDSVPSSFKPIGTTAVPPDAPIYPALRPCYANYNTMDSKLLLNRNAFVSVRKPAVDARITFLNGRETQIKQHIIDEEHFRAANGSTGNLYNWADNRFNRSNGCEARLKQVEKVIEMNQASLSVSKRFL
jgi:hypothetical protein